MEIHQTEKIKDLKSGYRKCLEKAMDRTQRLFCEDPASHDYEKIHAAKSILYATIEQAGMETERLISARELLCELLTLVSLRVDPVRRERREAFRILEKLKSRHHYN